MLYSLFLQQISTAARKKTKTKKLPVHKQHSIWLWEKKRKIFERIFRRERKKSSKMFFSPKP